MKIFLFIKDKSERLPNKNFLQLGGVELYKHTLLKLKYFEVVTLKNDGSFGAFIFTKIENNSLISLDYSMV